MREWGVGMVAPSEGLSGRELVGRLGASLHLPVGVIEPAGKQGDDMSVRQPLAGNPILGKFAASRVAQAAGLDFPANESRREVTLRISTEGNKYGIGRLARPLIIPIFQKVRKNVSERSEINYDVIGSAGQGEVAGAGQKMMVNQTTFTRERLKIKRRETRICKFQNACLRRAPDNV